MRRTVLTTLTILLAAGCARHAQEEGLKTGSGHSSLLIRSGGSIAPEPDKDAPRRVPQLVILLDVYDLTVPLGAISTNDDFWKRVDEDQVDVAAHDLLLKNGVRFGIAHDRDWTYFKGLMGGHPEAMCKRMTSQAGREGNLEIPIRAGVPEQILFRIDENGVDWGRRFEKCDDLLGISFILAPHHVGETLIRACPIVRGLRETFSVSVLNNEQSQIEQKHIEHLYDMRLEAAVPINDFLIIAPSKQASILTTSIGATFLLGEGTTAPVEHVLIAVPRTYRSDETPPSMSGK